MLPRLLRRLAHDTMVAGAGLILRTGWRQSRHERVRLGTPGACSWGQQRSTSVSYGPLGRAAHLRERCHPGPGRAPCCLWHARDQRLGLRWNPLIARNRQKPRISEASQLRRLHDSPPARNRIGSGAAVGPVEGGGRLRPLNATVGSEPSSETGPSSTPGPDSDVIYEGEPAC
jgi:hypothetical protein